MSRPGMSKKRLDGILRQQVPDAMKRRKATIVIPTGLGLAPTRLALAKAMQAEARPVASGPPIHEQGDLHPACAARRK